MISSMHSARKSKGGAGTAARGVFGAADDMGYLRRAGKRSQFQDFSRCQQRGQHRVKFFEEPGKTEEGTRTT